MLKMHLTSRDFAFDLGRCDIRAGSGMRFDRSAVSSTCQASSFDINFELDRFAQQKPGVAIYHQPCHRLAGREQSVKGIYAVSEGQLNRRYTKTDLTDGPQFDFT